MKEYKCHKTVKAAKIESIISNRKDFGRVPHPDREWRIEFTEQGDGECFVSQEWMEKHKPKCGGYVVVYEDGYMSFSPAQAFESGYTLVAPSHTFSRNAAIEYIARAIGEGYSPSQFAPSLLTYPHLVSLLSSSFLQEEYGRAWDWYNKGCNDLLDKGLVNAAPVVQVDGESFEMGGVKFEGNSKAATFEAVTRPVIQWMNDNAHPHSAAVIDQTSAALTAEEIVYGTNDYLKD